MKYTIAAFVLALIPISAFASTPTPSRPKLPAPQCIKKGDVTICRKQPPYIPPNNGGPETVHKSGTRSSLHTHLVFRPDFTVDGDGTHRGSCRQPGDRCGRE